MQSGEQYNRKAGLEKNPNWYAVSGDGYSSAPTFSGGEAAIPKLISLSFQGRFGRLSYLNGFWAIFGFSLLSLIIIGIVSWVFSFLNQTFSGVISVLAMIGLGIYVYILYLRNISLRAHDLNISTLAILIQILVIPIALSIITFIVGISSGLPSRFVIAVMNGDMPMRNLPTFFYIFEIINMIYGAYIFFLNLYLLVWAGKKETNAWGAPPRQGSYVGLILTIISLLGLVGIILYAASQYY